MKNRPHALQKFTKGQILISFYPSEGKILVRTAVSTACEPGAERSWAPGEGTVIWNRWIRPKLS